MFVKVEFPDSGQVTIYECDTVTYQPHLEGSSTAPDSEYYLVLKMEKDRKILYDGVGLWFEKEEVNIYLMNNNGKTIDKIMWQNGGYK